MLFDNCIPFRARSVVASTVIAFVGTVAFAGAASADDSDQPPTRPCFMVRPHWNVALDGPQPTCPAP
jgi:hypothetical protein